ncbi:MAG: vitamin K epoxide reductase [Anaerolineae bacterium]|nr:vitamin K epoxide reductase [Anaerolineae bacterium]
MLKSWLKIGLLLCMALCLTGIVRAQELPVVRAVLFYSPTCSHCHTVMTEVLPPLREQYGEQLQVYEIDISTGPGRVLFDAAVRINPEVTGVPVLVIGDNYLIGGKEIPDKLSGLIEQYYNAGGVELPAIPDLEKTIVQQNLAPGGGEISTGDLFMRDVTGNSLSVIVLIGLIAAFVSALRPSERRRRFADQAMPMGFYVVMVVGLIAAGYLTYVELTSTEAVCGPVGDCNAVQQSQYARLFGILPIALFGLIGYLMILASYLLGAFSAVKWAKYVPAITFFLAMFGLAFSIYLTFLEPFVIGATCAWCLTSAICMLLLTLLLADRGWHAVKVWQDDGWRRKAARRKARYHSRGGA